MISIELYLAFVAACAAVIIVPGPTVTIIIANSLRHGSSAGLGNVAGTQFGLIAIIAVLAGGLQYIVTNLSFVFDVIRIVGAAYLIWIGVKMLRSDGKLSRAEPESAGSRSFFWQGVFVILSNPKALFFLGAFLPQFIDPNGNTVVQTLVLGLTFMVVATVLDGAYALAAGRAGHLLSRSRVRLLEKVSGVCMIGGGLWLALSRRA